MIALDVAEHLNAQGIVNFHLTDEGGDCFIDHLPDQPDDAVAIFSSPGPGVPGILGYDQPGFQVRTRSFNLKTAHDKAKAIYDELHKLRSMELPSGTWLVQIIGTQSSPAPLGPDAANRHEYTQNYQSEIRAVTAHRV